MNTYSLSILSSWWFPVLFIISGFGLAFYSYRRTLPPISPRLKYILIALRTIGIALLLIVLFEPVLTIIRGAFEPPRLAVLLDNSLSTGLKDAKVERKSEFNSAIKNSKFMDLDNNSLRIGLFDSDVRLLEKFSPDSVNHRGLLTDISKSLRWVINSSEEENIRAVLLITDGAFNSGNNPIYDADALGKPIYIIGIGDSTEPKDITVQSLITNDIAYVDNPIPVNVNVKVSGYNTGDIKLKLLDNGNLVSEQVLKVNPDKNVFTSVFEYLPKQEGVHKLTAQASSFEGELTQKNNSYSEFVNVLKNKRRIILFAGSPEPDVSFIKNSLSKEKGVDVKPFIQKQGSEFYDAKPTQADIQDAEVIVFVGFPITSTPMDVIEMIKIGLSKGKQLLFVASQMTDYNKLKQFDEYLPFTSISSNSREYLAIGDFKKEAGSNPLIKISGSDKDVDKWNQLPPIFRTETFVKVKPETEVLATIKVNNVPMKEPMIMTRSFQNSKCVAVIGYGLYRWKLLGYAAEISKGRTDAPDLFDMFVQNSYKWLSINQDKKNIIIRTSKKLYTSGEKVEFIAQVYDASYNPVENANITVKISGGIQNRELLLNSLGNGRYDAYLEGLAEGDYYFTGDVLLNGNKLGSDKGRFNVGDISLEYLNTQMNASLLRNIAERTGGKFYLPDNLSKFLDDLKKNFQFQSQPVTKRNEYALWNLAWLLAIALLSFVIEWFLRKRAGMV